MKSMKTDAEKAMSKEALTKALATEHVMKQSVPETGMKRLFSCSSESVNEGNVTPPAVIPYALAIFFGRKVMKSIERTFSVSSESDNEGHPGKLCDPVSDAVDTSTYFDMLCEDIMSAQEYGIEDAKSKVACETVNITSLLGPPITMKEKKRRKRLSAPVPAPANTPKTYITYEQVADERVAE